MMAAGDAKDGLIPDVVQDLARKDLAAAAEFLKQQDSDKAQSDGMRELMPTWTSQNPVAALNYAYSFPKGPVRDSALQDYVMSNTTTAPAELVKIAAMIDDPGDREKIVP